MAAEPILAIDVGADSIKMAQFSYPGAGSIVLEDFEIFEYGSNVDDETELQESVCQALQLFIRSTRLRAKKAYVCMSPQLIFTKFVKLPPVTDPAQLQQIVEFEAKQNLPFTMDEIVWDHQLVNGATSADMEALFVVVKRDLIERITSIIESTGRQTILVDSAPTAGYNAMRMNGIGENECAMLLNIGGRCSTLLFVDENRVYVRSIAIAGHYITEQIAKEFNLSYRDAEDMKRRFGFVSLGGAYEEPESEVAATVSKIVRNAMTRLHGEINRSINVYRAQQGGRRPEKLYLAGGSSVLAYTPRFFEEKLRMPVAYLNPFQVVSISPAIDKNSLSDVAHMFSDVIGVGMRGVSACPLEISLMPDSLKKEHVMRARRPYLYASAITLAACFGITYAGLSFQAERVAQLPRQHAALISETEQLSRSIADAKTTLETKIEEYKAATALLSTRSEWTDILNGIQDMMPYNAWVVDMNFNLNKTQETVMLGMEDENTPPERKNPFINLSIYVLCTKSDPTGQNAWAAMESAVRNNENLKNIFASIALEKSSIYQPKAPNTLTNNLTHYNVKIELKKPLSLE